MRINEIEASKADFVDKLSGINPDVRDAWVDFANNSMSLGITFDKDFGNAVQAIGLEDVPGSPGGMDNFVVIGYAKAFYPDIIESDSESIYNWDEPFIEYKRLKDKGLTFQALKNAMHDFMGN